VDRRNCCPIWRPCGPGIEIERNFEAALRQSQVVMMLRIQAERLAGLQLDLEEYKANYQLTGQKLATQPDRHRHASGPIIAVWK